MTATIMSSSFGGFRCSTPLTDPTRTRDSGHGCGHADQMPANAPALDAAPSTDYTQTALVERNALCGQKVSSYIGRHHVQDIIRQPPGITNTAPCNSMVGAFDFSITPAMLSGSG